MKDPILVHHYFSPLVGWLELCLSDRGVQSVSYIKAPSSVQDCSNERLAKSLIQELDRYFSGHLVSFSVPLDPASGTPFQRQVWSELTKIPYGRTRSYREVAKAVGNPRGARAIGSANRANRIPILVPCHRVIKSDGSLGGYGSGLDIKTALLELEGIAVK